MGTQDLITTVIMPAAEVIGEALTRSSCDEIAGARIAN
jgi:hypothetical protein